MGTVRSCRHCGTPFDLNENFTSRKKYCSTSCRQKHHRQIKAARVEGGRRAALPEHIKLIKQLTNYHNEVEGVENMPIDVVREMLNDAVRENVTQFVQDNILGAVEIMTGMLPKAMAALARDLDSPDAFERQRAYQVLLKYLMPMHDKAGKKDDLGQLTVIHQIPLPNTPLGEKVQEELEHEVITVPDEGWPQCYVCHEQKHPRALRYHDSRGGGRQICQGCYARKKFRQGNEGAGSADLEGEGSFG